MTREPALDLGYLGLFVGMRINELVLDRARAAGFGALRESHGYVVQHLLGGPKTITELAGLLGVSQQAASKTVAELARARFVTRTRTSADRRARAIALSSRGAAAVAHVRATRARLERRLVARHGAAIARTRGLLARILADLGGLETVRARRVRQPR